MNNKILTQSWEWYRKGIFSKIRREDKLWFWPKHYVSKHVPNQEMEKLFNSVSQQYFHYYAQTQKI